MLRNPHKKKKRKMLRHPHKKKQKTRLASRGPPPNVACSSEAQGTWDASASQGCLGRGNLSLDAVRGGPPDHTKIIPTGEPHMSTSKVE